MTINCRIRWLLLHLTPGFVGIVFCHCTRGFIRRLPEILLVHNASLVYEEGHDARITVFSGIGKHRKADCHLAIDEVVLRPTRRIRSLLVQHFGEVAVEWLMLIGLCLESLARGQYHERPERAAGLPFGSRPVQAVLFAVIADELLRVL